MIGMAGGGMSASNSSAASSGGSGDISGSTGGQTFNFMPPQSLQEKTISSPVMFGAIALAALWLYFRKK